MNNRFADRLLLVFLLTVAAAFRFTATTGELWLDEIQSVVNANGLSSWIDVFTRLRTDNNHHLISLWFYAVGDRASALTLRLPSLVFGVATVAMVYTALRRVNRASGVIAGLLFAVSYSLVYYSTEARGYALVVFFTLAAWLILQQYLLTSRWAWAVAFWTCCLLGILSHLTFGIFFISALVWTDLHLQRSPRSLRVATRTMAIAFGVPLVLFAALFLLVFRGSSFAGGPPIPKLVLAAQSLSSLVGGPGNGPGLWMIAAGVAALFVWSLHRARVRGDDRWLMYALGGLVLPVIALVGISAPIYSRYLLVPASLILLSIATLAADLCTGGPAGLTVVAALVVVATTGTTVHLREFRRLQRGRYEDIVRTAALSREPRTIASGDDFTLHDIRNAMLVDYYARRLGQQGSVRYISEADYPSSGPHWFIRESLGEPGSPTITDMNGNTFVLRRTYRSNSMTGLTWHLYENQAVR